METDGGRRVPPAIEALGDETLRAFHRDMVLTRRFDHEAGNLQRQGQLALWVPSHGQEGAQVGSAHALRPQDHLFPSYREHAVGCVARRRPGRRSSALLRGADARRLGPGRPRQLPRLHARDRLADPARHGLRHGHRPRRRRRHGRPDARRGRRSRTSATVRPARATSTRPRSSPRASRRPACSSCRTTTGRSRCRCRSQSPHARSSTVRAASASRATQVDGNDVLASYAVSASRPEHARSGQGPAFIEALTYRIGAHTTLRRPHQVPHRRRARRLGGP